jgi:formate dehydrogenase subunit gamma
MAKSSTPEGRGAKWRRYLFAMIIAAATVMALPLTGYLATGVSMAQDSAGQSNPRADVWREVRDGVAGTSAVTGQETNILIANGGQNWRQLRNDVIATIGAWAIVGIILALALYHVLTGGNKLEKPLSGELVERWSVVDRVLHWYTAILFIILAITGLSILWGRNVLIPMMGPEGFAAWANIAKPIHDYLAVFFLVGMVVMLLKWMKHNFFKSYDLQWIVQGGGYLPNGKHPKAGFCNAGEKLLYWTLFFIGGAMIVSGVFLLFPNFGFTRETMQLANLVHGFTSLFVIGFICLHIYLATIGSPGALRGMTTGKVDATWAAQHHSVWYEEVTGRPAHGHHEPGGAAPTPSPAARMP